MHPTWNTTPASPLVCPLSLLLRLPCMLRAEAAQLKWVEQGLFCPTFPTSMFLTVCSSCPNRPPSPAPDQYISILRSPSLTLEDFYHLSARCAPSLRRIPSTLFWVQLRLFHLELQSSMPSSDSGLPVCEIGFTLDSSPPDCHHLHLPLYYRYSHLSGHSRKAQVQRLYVM